MKWLSYAWTIVWNLIVFLILIKIFEVVSYENTGITILLSMLVFIYTAIRMVSMQIADNYAQRLKYSTEWNIDIIEEIRRGQISQKEEDFDPDNEILDHRSRETFSEVRNQLNEFSEKINKTKTGTYIATFFLILMDLIATFHLLSSI